MPKNSNLSRVLSGLLLVYPFVALAGGSIEGKVTYQGGRVSPRTVAIGVDAHVCGHHQELPELLVNHKGEVRNALVFLKGPVPGGRPLSSLGSRFVIDQKGCLFSPRILIVPRGSEVIIQNSDGILHNFHTYSKLSPAINRAQMGGSEPIRLRLSRPEIIRYECDVHSWMRGWIVAAENPYYVLTGENGDFRLTDVPAGRYTVQVWQEVLGTFEKKVEVMEGGSATMSIRYPAREPEGKL